jgi:prevent-host-death family protein
MTMYSEDMVMKTIAATEFKARCLKLIEEVRKTGLPVVVTKRGVPIVRILPAERPDPDLEGTVLFEADDITTTGVDWEADRG